MELQQRKTGTLFGGEQKCSNAFSLLELRVCFLPPSSLHQLANLRFHCLISPKSLIELSKQYRDLRVGKSRRGNASDGSEVFTKSILTFDGHVLFLTVSSSSSSRFLPEPVLAHAILPEDRKELICLVRIAGFSRRSPTNSLPLSLDARPPFPFVIMSSSDRAPYRPYELIPQEELLRLLNSDVQPGLPPAAVDLSTFGGFPFHDLPLSSPLRPLPVPLRSFSGSPFTGTIPHVSTTTEESSTGSSSNEFGRGGEFDLLTTMPQQSGKSRGPSPMETLVSSSTRSLN